MKHKSSSAGDEKFVDLICAYEEALTGSTEARAIDESVLNEDPAMAERLDAATRGLKALDRVRRRWMPDAEVLSDAAPEPPDTSRDLETEPIAQRKIGRFRIQHELGRGGVGVVFLGYDPKLRRQIALKVPGEEALASADLRARFLREAEASARLDHPNVVSVFEVGEAGPLCYIASEFCSGPTLRQWLRESDTPMEPHLAAQWTAQLAEAVQHAHGRGVLHRDIKPSNVLLTARQSNADKDAGPQSKTRWTPKLADFGMAKLLESQELHDATRTGTLIGTIPYMAPEQAKGRTSQIDVRSDVYGLGALLYELLTRRPPFLGDSDADTLRQLLFTEVVPPSQHRQGIPRDLEAICLKCLEKNPSRRYATAQELSDDLRRFLRGQPTEARPPGTMERIAMWVRRRPAAAAVSAAVLVATLTLFGVVTFYSARLGTALKQTQFQRNRAEQEALMSGQLLYSANVRLASDALSNGNREEAVALLQHHIPEDSKPDQREFAWHYLWQQCHPDTQDLLGHDGEVFSVAFSPDGSLLASASKDGTARLWDLSTGKTRFKLEGHTSEVTAVAFDPQGNRIATGSEDRTVRIWHTATGKLNGVLTGHTDHVLCVAYSPDGDWLATGGRDKTVKIWDAHSLDSITTLEGAEGNVRALDFSADGELLVADESGSLLRFDVNDRRLKSQNRIADEAFYGATYSHDLPWVAAAGRLQIGHVFRSGRRGLTVAGKLVGGHTEWIQGVAFSPGDNTLATAGKDGVIQLWAVGDTDSKPRSLIGHEGRAWGIAWSPNGRQLASAGADHSIKIWDVDSIRSPTLPYPRTNGGVNHLAFSSNGRRLFTADTDGVVRMWDPRSRRLLRVVERLNVEVSALALSPSEDKLAAIDFAGRTHAWNLEIWSHDVLAQSPERAGHCLAWSPRGDSLAITRDERTVAVIDTVTGQERFRKTEPEKIAWIQYLENGNQLVVCSDKTRFWDVPTGELRLEMKGAWRGQISHDGRMLAISTGKHIVELWDIQSAKLRRRLIADTSRAVGPMGFSPDDRTFAVGDRYSGDVTLWDARTGQTLYTHRKTVAGVSALAFSPCGQHLLTAGRSKPGRMVQWSVPPDHNRFANGQHRATDSFGATESAHDDESRSYIVLLTPRIDARSSSLRSFRIFLGSQLDKSESTDSSAVVDLDVSFHPAQLLPESSPGAIACAVGDIDSDGDLDIAAANSKSNQVVWYVNDGLGRFGSAQIVDQDYQSPEDVALADIDHNGQLDIVAPSSMRGQVRWYRRSEDSAKYSLQQFIKGLDQPHALITADLNGDGFEDVIWADRERDRIGCALNKAGESLSRIAYASHEAGSGESLVAADFDLDGDIDLLASSNQRGKLLWIENTGRGRFSNKHTLLSYQGSSRRPDVADLDNDGDIDIVVPFKEEDRCMLFENLADGQFRASQLPTIPGTNPLSVASGDLDGDGAPDLVVGGRRSALISVYLNDGTGHFTRSNHTVKTRGQGFDDVEVSDLNGDGKADIVFASYRGPGIGWNEGAGLVFAQREASRHQLRYVPWNRNGLAVALPTREPQEGVPPSLTLRLSTIDDQVLNSNDFSQLVQRVVVYADTNQNGLAETQWEPLVAELDEPKIQDGILQIPIQSVAHPSSVSDSHIVGDEKRMGFVSLMDSVNRWATEHGYVAALPICDGNHRDDLSPTNVVALSGLGCKLIDLTLDELSMAGALPLSDSVEPDTLYAQNSSCIDIWARAHGYRAGILIEWPDREPTGSSIYRALVFLEEGHNRLPMSMTKLDYPVGFESLCEKVQQQAETLGYVAGFPVLVGNSETVECILLRANKAAPEQIPVAELR